MQSYAKSIQRQRSFNLLKIAAFAILTYGALPLGFAQLPDPGERAQRVPEQQLATDRKATQLLKSFRTKLASGKVSGALDDLEFLRASDPHVLVPSNYPNVFVPLYRAVFDATYEIPAKQRRLISESQSPSSPADLAESQPEEIPDMILRNAGNSTAVDAHFLAARLHLLRGNYVAARSWLVPLARGHMPEDFQRTAKSILATFPETDPSVTDELGPQSTAAGDLPKYLTWQTRPSMSPKLQKQIEVFLKAAHAAKTVPQTVWAGNTTEQVAFRRSLRGLQAIDLQSGKTTWEYPIGNSVDSMIIADRANAAVFNRPTTAAVDASSFASLEKSPLANAFCRDNSLGRIASDTKHLYVITNNDEAQPTFNGIRIRFAPGGSATGSPSSKLIAVEKASGRRVWTLGQSTLEESLGASSSGCWMAGPPATNGRRLYSVVEWNGEMRLACIAAHTGELEWSTSLAYPEQTIDKDAIRRLWAATPEPNNGLIWCPTTAGWLVCVDEITRSPIYASGIQPKSLIATDAIVGRNQPVVFTPFASLNARSSTSRLIPAGSRLAVISQETRDIVIIDAITGEQVRHVLVGPGEHCVYFDATRIILADTERIRAITTASGKELWNHQLHTSTVYPIGEAADRGSHILIPMSDGSITQVDLKSGDFVETSDLIIPSQSWGRLQSVPGHDGDLLYIAPDRISRISAVQPDDSPGNPLEIASGLMAAGNWEEALATAKQVPVSDSGRPEAEAIIFTSRLQLAASAPEKYLAELKSSRLTAEQTIQVQIFEAATAHNKGASNEAAEKIVDLLATDSANWEANAPQIASLWVSERGLNVNEPALLSAQQSLLTWTAARFSELAEQSPASFTSDRFADIADEAILAIHHPIIRPTLHERMRTTASEELFWHLLQHSVSIQSGQPENDLRTEVEIAEKRYGQASVQTRLPTDAMRLLLAISFREAAPGFQVCVDRLQPQLDRRLADQAESLTGQFSTWNAKSYSPVPVSRSQNISSRIAQINTVEKEDAFLGEYNWSVVQGESGRLVANRVADLQDHWSIPGNFQVFANYSMYSDLMHRAGTVILLKTSQGLSAVSALDQRVLWTRSPQGAGRSGFATSAANFDQFVAGRHHLPSRNNFSAYQIVGYGHRWACIQSGPVIEVLDLYSGQVRWSVKLTSPFNRAFATDDFVIAGSMSTRDVACFDRHTGAPVNVDNAAELSTNTIRNIGPLAVTWNEGGDVKPNTIEWINPGLGATTKSVSLAGMESFHFLDDRTLIGVNSEQQFMAVDLISSTSKVYSFRTGDSTALKEDAKPDTPANGPPGLELWDHRRIHVTSDPLNYYVSNRVGLNAVPFRQSFGRSSLRFEGDLRAIDRVTGDLRWVVRCPSASVATTDQPELPFLAMWDDGNQMVRMPGKSAASFMRGYDKLTGKELFRQHVPSRYGWRFVDLKAPATEVVDITVHGTRLRLIGQSD